MDSVSQFVLGAAIGEATMGQRIGRKALLLGGLLGTLPDLDVLVHYAGAVESFTYHRSWSHSLFVLGVLSLPIAWLLWRYFPSRWRLNASAESSITSANHLSYGRWLLCVFLVLMTHPLLDGFTIYGTQLFWPLPVNPVAIGSIFIIDPLYTVPLIIGIAIAFRNRQVAKKTVLVGLFVSSTYLLATVALQQHVRNKSIQALRSQNLPETNVRIGPTPLSLLWRIVSVGDDQYYEGFSSLLDKTSNVHFDGYDTGRALISEYSDQWSIARLDWFTGGQIAASREGDELIISDLRMGIESSYVFRFLVGRWNQDTYEPTQSVKLPLVIDTERMRQLLKRTWDEQLIVTP